MSARNSHPRAVLFDRDGTLVVDVPYNGDPLQVEPMPTVGACLQTLRAANVPIGVVSNQSGIGRGILSIAQVGLVNRRIEQLLGPFTVWRVCPHALEDACSCRKPKPGMILDAAATLRLDPSDLAVIGDIGSDIAAAEAAGARSVLVPTPVTRAEEVRNAPLVAHDVASAIDVLFPEGVSS